jgi:hypothetical protein
MNTGRPGITGVMSLAARCDRQRDGCWIWTGYVIRGRPSANIKGHGSVHGQRIAAIAAGRDHERQPHQRWIARCGNELCLSPRCLHLATHREAHTVASAAGRLKRTPDQVARNRVARARRGDVVPAELVRWALESPQSSSSVAHAIGCHPSAVRFWRRGAMRQTVTCGPYEQLLAA